MNFKLKTHNQFEKDLKRLKKRGKNLPAKNKAHKLSGNWSPYWECHIEPDWLLVYIVSGDVLTLVRSGTHSDLF